MQTPLLMKLLAVAVTQEYWYQRPGAQEQAKHRAAKYNARVKAKHQMKEMGLEKAQIKEELEKIRQEQKDAFNRGWCFEVCMHACMQGLCNALYRRTSFGVGGLLTSASLCILVYPFVLKS